MNKEIKSILVVDDEIKLLYVLSSFLENRGFKVIIAENGNKALEIFKKEKISLIILDLMLPDISGESVCQKIREISSIPIIMLTAKSREESLLQGLNLGADDYITKPFSLKELHARIIAILRRTDNDLIPLTTHHIWNNNDLYIDFNEKIIKKNNKKINLTIKEMNILFTLIKHPSKIFTREELVGIALGDDFDGYNRTIDSHIKNLRKKIEDNPKLPIYIITVHGIGYKFGGE